MKACVLYEVGDLRYGQVAEPEPGEGWVRLKVAACGVCGSDVPRVFQNPPHRLPLIPGHEFAGVVEAVGAGVDKGYLGLRAAVFPLLPCRKCAPCEVGQYALCEDYDYIGSRRDGAFAEYVCAPVWNLVPVPDGVSLEEAAMAEPAAVALHTIRKAAVDAGDTVLILGTGPIGLMLAQWARRCGAARVMLADIDARKLEFAREHGFTEVANPAETPPALWVHDRVGRGADVAIEASGSAAAYGQALLAARPFGRVVLMGNPAGEMKLSQEAYWAILRKELTLCGTWNSAYSQLPHNEWQIALEAMADGSLVVAPLITHRVDLEALPAALGMLRAREEFACKVLAVASQEA